MTITVPSMQDLLSAGVHFGHQVRRGHPRMKEYIFGAREGVHILDLEKTEALLKEATQAAYELGKQGKVLLIVGTKKQAQDIVEELAKEADTPYLNKRWVGGILTNFDEIKRNIKKLTDLKEEQEKGTLSRYTKREQLLISRKLEKFTRDLGGMALMSKVPDALFIVDAVSDKTAVREATRMGITLIGLTDTNADPTPFLFPIPANDDGIKSIKLVCETVIKAYGQGKKEGGESAKVTEETKVTNETKVEEPKGTKEPKEPKVAKDEKSENAEVAETVADEVEPETAALEEIVEKVVLEESERKV